MERRAVDGVRGVVKAVTVHPIHNATLVGGERDGALNGTPCSVAWVRVASERGDLRSAGVVVG